VRQPLAKIMVPVLNDQFKEQFQAVENIILSEVNVKEVEYLTDTSDIIKKKIKPNFKTLGPKYGKMMKQIAGAVAQFTSEEIASFEKNGSFELTLGDEWVSLSTEDIEIVTEDIPGWLVATEGGMTIALDINLTNELKQEGIAREFINKIQNLRKESNFEVTDRIRIKIEKHDFYNESILNYKEYISNQTLAETLDLVEKLNGSQVFRVEIEQDVEALVQLNKIS
jgi:isoleucyl-tRNA synthetase